MFKNVEFVGFEGHPELRAKAEHAHALLGDVVTGWRDEVEVTWRPAPAGSGGALELTLALALWNAAAEATGVVRPVAFEPGEEHLLRIDLRGVWSDLLGALSRKQVERLKEWDFETAEA